MKKRVLKRLISNFPSLYILFNKKNGSMKIALINLKGYKAIKENNLLNWDYYLKNNSDVNASGMDPILHYIYYGSKENRKPNSHFDSNYYLNRYIDVKKSNLNPLVHYSLYGIHEGRKTQQIKASPENQLKKLEKKIENEKIKFKQSESKLIMLENEKIKLFTSITHKNLQNTDSLKLNIGCGNVKFPDWVNIDIEPGADLVVDVRDGLPLNDNSANFIYNEHFIEHLKLEDGEKSIKEFYRVLEKGGVLRIATPDLDYTIKKYLDDWKNQDWLTWPAYEYIKTRGLMINVSMREWGHKYLYNEEDLSNLLKSAGFQKITKHELNKSDYPELANLETRKDSKLILEAQKLDNH